jgi:hypothetical protein
LVPSGTRYVIKAKNGRVLADFSSQAGSRVRTALSKSTRLDQLDDLGRALDEGVLTHREMEALVDSRLVPTYDKSHSARILRGRLGDPQPGLRRPQAHHDLPLAEETWFLKHGLDPNAHGRWVEGGPYGTHQKNWWLYNEDWKKFRKAESERVQAGGLPYSRSEILSFRDGMIRKWGLE